MISIEKALLLNLTTGLSIGAGWRDLNAPAIPSDEVPNTLVLNGVHLAELRRLLADEAEPVVEAVEALSAKAESILEEGPWSVVDKPNAPEGFDPRNYLSLAKYWWPDPGRPDGRPYVRKDGQVNPACYSEDYDSLRLVNFSGALLTLTLSAFLSGNEKHAKRAVELLKRWFLDPDTRQHPHFEHAQSIPGKHSVRGPGTIEARHFIYAAECISLLEHMNALTPTEYAGLKGWYESFLQWMLESEMGVRANTAHNNIGLWYDLQCLAYAWFVGNHSLAEEILVRRAFERFVDQVSRDGGLTAELSREKPFEYVTFTLTALAGLAQAGEKMGIPIWDAETSDGRSFQAAYEWFQALPMPRELHVALSNSRRSLTASPDTGEFLTDAALQTGLLTRVAESRRLLVEELRGKLSKKDHQLTASLEEKKAALINHEKVQAELASVQNLLVEKERRLTALNDQLKAEKSELATTNAQLKRRVGQLEKKLTTMRNSLSYRVTKPLRSVIRLLGTVGLVSNNAPKTTGSPKKAKAQRRRPDLKERINRGIDWLRPTANLKRTERQIERLRVRMLNLGFLEKGESEMTAWAASVKNPTRQMLASAELARLYLNEETADGSRKALQHLATLSGGALDSDWQRRAAVMSIQAHLLLGDDAAGKEVLSKELGRREHPDLFLAGANLERLPERKLTWINKALAFYKLQEVFLKEDPSVALYDRLMATPGIDDASETKAGHPLLSVIVPAYNSRNTITSTITSLLTQTWRNIEILVVDDCSTDETVQIVRSLCERDSRIRLIQASVNNGPYVARNLALKEAQGEFVTCNDADDWSHPQKLELQAKHLLDYPRVIGNTSQQARATADLEFYLRGQPGYYIFKNMSSFMFRRKLVQEKIGFWDSVRFAADSEFLKRIRIVFGKDAVVSLETGPLSFQRQSRGSLTGNEHFGYNGFFMGARKEYHESQAYFHKVARTLKYDFPQRERPFQVPEPVRPNRTSVPGTRRHFDVIIASEFRMTGGSTLSNAEEIKAQRKMGLKTGLIQLSRYDLNPNDKTLGAIRDLLDEENTQMIVYGEKVSCDLLIIRYPPVLQEFQRFIPDVKAEHIRVIVNQTPMSDYSDDSVLRYNIPRCEEHLQKYFSKRAIWHPIGPLVREALEEHHKDELSSIELSAKDWSNIIDVGEWLRPKRPKNERPRIGRHARGYKAIKWPDNKEDLLRVYPDSDKYDVSILGGASAAKDLIGKLPRNWHVQEFGTIDPREYLSKLDVFVYYIHPDLVESFGRVIIEAMAAGVPTILPFAYKPLFQEAAIYSEPEGVQRWIDCLMEDPAFYDEQARTALDYVRRHFSYEEHARRVGEFLRTKTPLAPNPHAVASAATSYENVEADPAVLDEAVLQREVADYGTGKNPGLSRVVNQLIADAEEALGRGPHTVVNKRSLPPSKDLQDYWHPAPYWWPNPETEDGLPFVRRDGERVPGTILFEASSDRYDRTRVQHLFDDTFALALASRFSSRQEFADHAVQLLETFFLDPDTCMNPHLNYAQVRLGHNNDIGNSTGIIELKDFYFYLDAIRLLEANGTLPAGHRKEFRQWLKNYLDWLIGSRQGKGECKAANNHGTYYDLQVLSIADFLREHALVREVLDRAGQRLEKQFGSDGSQPEELTRKTSAHYCCFNLQGWLYLNRFALRYGRDFSSNDPSNGSSLSAGAEWLLAHRGKTWPYEQIDEFDPERFLPIAFDTSRPSGSASSGDSLPGSPLQIKSRFHPHDGIRPYWNLGQSPCV